MPWIVEASIVTNKLGLGLAQTSTLCSAGAQTGAGPWPLVEALMGHKPQPPQRDTRVFTAHCFPLPRAAAQVCSPQRRIQIQYFFCRAKEQKTG